jgi:O-acetyl-ADP-ribose deacetylase (regulator of RNase III)
VGLTIERGSVVRLDVDAIVSAANERLANAGGVALAIEQAAGPAMAEACRRAAPCPTGDVRVTPGFDLAARWVIHAVGPVWSGGQAGEEELLRQAYRRILEEAAQRDIATLGVIPLSVGIFGYPLAAGCAVAIEELSAAPATLDVRLCAFREDEHAVLTGLAGA